MEVDVKAYPFNVRYSDEDECYIVEFPDVPGCIADGKTPEEAIQQGQVYLKDCLDLIKEMKRPIPQPGSVANTSEQLP